MDHGIESLDRGLPALISLSGDGGRAPNGDLCSVDDARQG